MEKKKSTGITIFGILWIIGGVYFFLFILPVVAYVFSSKASFEPFNGFEKWWRMSQLFLSILAIVIGIGILKHKEAIRRTLLFFIFFELFCHSSVTIFLDWHRHGWKGSTFVIFTAILFIPNFIFFTRPKVKEQFR